MLKNTISKITICFYNYHLKKTSNSNCFNQLDHNKTAKQQPSNNILWLAFFFACGCIFYIKFSANFHQYIYVFLAFALIALIIFLKNIFNEKSFIYLFILSFLSGNFYNLGYNKLALNYTKIKEKIYIKAEGKIVTTKKFYNPVNHQYGLNLLISSPIISKVESSDLIVNSHKKKQVKLSKKKKNTNKKKRANIVKRQYKKNSNKNKKKLSKLKKMSTTKIRNLVNLASYQEIDRIFLDYQKNYNNYDWLKINNHQQLAKPPPFISVNLIHENLNLKINDNVKFYATLQSPKSKDFIDDFDLNLDAKLKKISGYGYVISDVEIVERRSPKNHEEFLRKMREKISEKILTVLPNDEGGIALALLIGDQSQISSELLQKIRNCGLAHLLSISGFHLSLASVSFFMLFRFLLSHIPAIALRFDLKKISAIFALMASYIYLKIADTPIPAQRAFLMVCLLLLSYFIQERFNSKRALMLCLFILTLFNPYLLLNLSFQLSFIAILVMIFYYQDYHFQKSKEEIILSKITENKFFLNRLMQSLGKIFNYIREIIVISTIIQIATLPFLMQAFHNFSLIAPLTNIFAIPLASFVIMPIGFLSLFLMIFDLEKISLLTMKLSIILLEKIIIFFSDFNFSSFATGNLSLISLALCTFAIFLFFLQNQKIAKFIAILIFIGSFFIGKFLAKPALVFADNQKFYALYHPSVGLRFSKEVSHSKRYKNWLTNFNEKKFKVIDDCDSLLGIVDFCKKCTKNNEINYCQINYQKQRVLTVNQRNKISELCKIYNDYKPNIIINLTAKYSLPQCIFNNQSANLIIDNFDFLQQKTQLLYIKNDKVTRRFAD